jgi:protocatechuate 3,4-dioxygenase beta subunit
MHKIIILASVISAIALTSSVAQQSSTPQSNGSAMKKPEDTPLTSSVFSLDAMPSVCPETFMDTETEGPYYKTGSPERTDFVEDGTAGERFTLTGYVFDKDCKPVAGAWLDFWHADGKGVYDNERYRLRGHQFTDKQGRYILKTVAPGEYPGRTNHIHVKVSKQAGGASTTSQLYFPGGRLNSRDNIFNKSMLITIDQDKDGRKIGLFNFRLNQ